MERDCFQENLTCEGLQLPVLPYTTVQDAGENSQGSVTQFL